MKFSTTTSPYLHDNSNVSAVMLQVLLALIPGIAAYVWWFGWAIIINISIACVTAIIFESAILRLRKRPVYNTLSDYSAIVTAILLALALPTLAPWWLIVVACFFAIVIAKHLYGGIGYNPFNPAMIGYVVVLVSFPQHMTQWLLPHTDVSLLQNLQIQFQGLQLDGISGATPIDSLKTVVRDQQSLADINPAGLLGHIGGYGWEWIGASFLLGGLWLIYKGIISWQIPTGMLASIAAFSMIMFAIDAHQYSNPLVQLFSGGTILAAFFIATDPVTASTTPRGRLIYAAGIGILTYIIRTWGGYPDGIAFAVLLMNMAVPTIDYYTRPRVFGTS